METIGQLIDKLSIINIKIFHMQEKMVNEKDDHIVANSTRSMMKLNTERSTLVAEIDQMLNNAGVRVGVFQPHKTY